MTIATEHYLSCNVCHRLYEIKADSRRGLEDEAIDDGWKVLEDLGATGSGDILSTHVCPECGGDHDQV